MKKIIAVTIAMLMLFASMVSASAVPMPPCHSGDVNLSHDLSISDATLIQKCVADMAELSKAQIYLADTDSDGEVTVKDATLIQKRIAEISCDWDYDRYVYMYSWFEMFASDFDSGVAASGDEVTFMAKGISTNDLFVTYEFAVDGVVVSSGDEAQFTHTFSAPGTYKVSVTVRDKFDITATHTAEYVVAQPGETPDEFRVKAFYHNKNLLEGYQDTAMMIVGADGGSGEYEYEFMRDDEVIREYSSDNTCKFPEELAPPQSENYTFTVNVKDKATGDVVSRSILIPAYWVI